MLLPNNEIVIGEHNWHEQISPVVDGDKKSHGLIPRDYNTHPRGFYTGIKAIDIPLINPSEYSNRITDKTKEGSWLSDERLTGNNGQSIPSRDQDGVGYCWCHSGTSAMLVLRAKLNLPYVDLSAFSVGCKIKNYRDEGGWGAEGVDFMMKNGIATSEFWPQQSMKKSNDTPAMQANALLHRIVGEWADLAQAQYDRKLSWDQVITLLLSDVPVVSDFNWWSHSVLALDVVNGATQRNKTRDPASGKKPSLKTYDYVWAMDHPITMGLGIRIWNSWADSWSDRGMGVLTGNKAIPDGSIAPWGTTIGMN